MFCLDTSNLCIYVQLSGPGAAPALAYNLHQIQWRPVNLCVCPSVSGAAAMASVDLAAAWECCGPR